jgi:hypothetical protein
MKTIHFALLLISIPLFTKAQMGSVNFIDTSFQTSGITKIESVDLNNNGFKDLLVSNTGNSGRIGYYQNLSNNGFSNFNLIEPYGFCRGLAIGNFNADNWKDLVTIGGTNHNVKIHLNNSGTFSTGVLVDTSHTIILNEVVVANFDQTNADDFVVIGQHSIDFYRNNGSGSFTKEEILSTSTSPFVLECLDITAKDVDNDGDIDLISGETAGLVIYINNGNAVFTPHYYSLIPEIFFHIHSFDVDNDGDLDVVGRNSARDVKWFSNNGSGVMTYEATLANVPNITSLNSVDANGDGLEDLFVSYINHVSIFENDTNQSFNTEISVYQDNNRVMGVVQIADINGQGGLDVVWSGGTNGIAYHLNGSVLSVNEHKTESFSIYPNPTNGEIHFNQTIEKLTVYNAIGEKQFEKSNSSTIDLSNYPSGIYLLSLEDNGTFSRQKIVRE